MRRSNPDADSLEQLPTSPMDEGLIYPNSNSAMLDEASTYGIVTSESPASFARTDSVHRSRITAPDMTDLGLYWGGVLPESQQVLRTSQSLPINHASPLSPLRSRDSRALNEIFDRDKLPEISLDIHRCLARLYPEPCWEDEPYEFLHGFT